MSNFPIINLPIGGPIGPTGQSGATGPIGHPVISEGVAVTGDGGNIHWFLDIEWFSTFLEST